MSAREDYPAISVHSRWPGSEGEECKTALDEINNLRRWKAEALVVLAEWDEVWEAAGRPGLLGASKASNTRALVECLRQQKELLRTELAKWGWRFSLQQQYQAGSRDCASSRGDEVMGKDWRWYFRRQCNAIASCSTTETGIAIKLCHRWRWHRGLCA